MKFDLRAGILALGILGAASGAAWADAYQDGIKAFHGEDYAKALSLLLPYAKDGNAEAAYLIGEMYGPRSWGQKGENRNGVELDNKEAIFWWGEAAKLGNSDAQLKLGWWLMKGKDVVKQDQAAGMNWLLMAANQGEPQAQYEVMLSLQLSDLSRLASACEVSTCCSQMLTFTLAPTLACLTSTPLRRPVLAAG